MRTYTELLANCMDQYDDPIFTFDYDMCEYYKPIFERKFLLRFGYRNIGFETFAMFKLQLESTLAELLPKYNKLYESTQTPFNPFVNNIIKGSNFANEQGRGKNYKTHNFKSLGSGDDSSGSMGTNGSARKTGYQESDLSTQTGNVREVDTDHSKFVASQQESTGGMEHNYTGNQSGNTTASLKTDTSDTKTKGENVGESNTNTQLHTATTNLNRFADTPQIELGEVEGDGDGKQDNHNKYFGKYLTTVTSDIGSVNTTTGEQNRTQSLNSSDTSSTAKSGAESEQEGYSNTSGFRNNINQTHGNQHGESGQISSADIDTITKVGRELEQEAYDNANSFSNAVNQSKFIRRNQSYDDNEEVSTAKNTRKYMYEEESLKGIDTSTILKNWRSTFINVDAMLLDELETLFLGVY